MTDTISHVRSGAIAGTSHYFKADDADIPMFTPVIIEAAASGFYIPEVGISSTLADPKVIGVAVGPFFTTTPTVNDAAGQMIEVCTHGICKCKVDGNSDNIADGDALVHKAAASIAILSACDIPTTYVKATLETAFNMVFGAFAMALEASTGATDFIPVFVYGAMGTRT